MRVALLSFLVLGALGCGRERTYGETGEAVYSATCETCHGADGRGVNVAFPPLLESPWLQLSDAKLIRMALRGLQGPITVHDREFNNVMPPHAFLSDVELANVLTYVRSEFGTASAITPQQVATERPDYAQGPMWTISELAATPE